MMPSRKRTTPSMPVASSRRHGNQASIADWPHQHAAVTKRCKSASQIHSQNSKRAFMYISKTAHTYQPENIKHYTARLCAANVNVFNTKDSKDSPCFQEILLCCFIVFSQLYGNFTLNSCSFRIQ